MPVNPKFKRRVYTLKGKSPEVIAVAFAKCSRSPDPFDKIVKEINQDKASKFHEKYVVGFGHGSVAEHAYANIAIERVSQIAVKELEFCRLASYTEVSSRYQILSPEACFIPKVIAKSSGLKKKYMSAINGLYAVYTEALEPVKKLVSKEFPMEKGETEQVYDGRIRSKYADVCRMILPFAALRNVGLTANARSLEHIITRLLSSRYQECRELGADLKKVAKEKLPTLVKYAERNEGIVASRKSLDGLAKNVKPNIESGKFDVKLVDYDRNGADKFVAALIFEKSGLSYKSCLQEVKKMSKAKKNAWIKAAMWRLKDVHSKTPRALELINFTFDACYDHGTYYDLMRNRILTQLFQDSNMKLGYSVPKRIVEAGLRPAYCEVIESATAIYEELYKEIGNEADYLTTMANFKRVVFHMNMREFFYMLWYRGINPGGHLTYRRTTMKMYEEIKDKYPELFKYLPYKVIEGSEELSIKFFAK